MHPTNYTFNRFWYHLQLEINVWVLPEKTGVVSLTLQPNRSFFTPRHTVTGKGVAYVKQFDSKLPD